MILIVTIYDFCKALLTSLGGSIPQLGDFMAKLNVYIKNAYKLFEKFLNHWVTKATLLALGCRYFSPQPYAFCVNFRFNGNLSSREILRRGCGLCGPCVVAEVP